MTTNTAQVAPPVRQDPRQVANTLKKTINWNDSGVTNAGVISSVAFENSLPAGAVILAVIVDIIILFNGTTPILTVGTVGAGYNNMVNAGDVNEGAVGATSVARGLGQSLTASEVTPYVTLTLTTATTGQAVITILYEGGFSS